MGGAPAIAFNTLLQDASTESTAFTDLLCVPFTSATGLIDALATFAPTVTAAPAEPQQGFFQLWLDGAPVDPSGAHTDITDPGGAVFATGAISRVLAVAPGVPHTLCLRWRLVFNTGGFMEIEASEGEHAHASIRVMDVVVGL